jgi:hypothetical protein
MRHAASQNAMPVPPDQGAGIAAWAAAIEALPLEWRQKLAPRFAPYAIRAARQRAVDELVLLAAQGILGSVNAIAGELERRLTNYAAGEFRFDRGRAHPANRDKARLHQLLLLTGGKVPAARTLRRPLAELAKKS